MNTEARIIPPVAEVPAIMAAVFLGMATGKACASPLEAFWIAVTLIAVSAITIIFYFFNKNK